MPRAQKKGFKAHRAKHVPLSELVLQVFLMGRFMKEKMGKKLESNKHCNSLLEMETLRYAKEGDHPLMRDVARNFHMTPPAATLLIDNLVRGKRLERHVDSEDRRSVRIGITKYGRELLDEGMAERTAELKKLFSVLTPAERTQFTAIIKKIIKNHS